MKRDACPIAASTAQRAALPSIDFFDSAFKAAAHAAYATLRERAPVHRAQFRDGRPLWLVTRRDDVLKVLKAPRFVKDRLTTMTSEEDRAAAAPLRAGRSARHRAWRRRAAGFRPRHASLHRRAAGAARRRDRDRHVTGRLRELRLAVPESELRWCVGPLARGLQSLPLAFEPAGCADALTARAIDTL